MVLGGGLKTGLTIVIKHQHCRRSGYFHGRHADPGWDQKMVVLAIGGVPIGYGSRDDEHL